DHSEFRPDDRPTVGTPRPIAGSGNGDVIRAGHSEAPTQFGSPSDPPWRRPEPRESYSPATQPAAPSEKALPRTATVPVGDSPYRPSPVTPLPARTEAKTQRYDVTIYRAQFDDTWERVSMKHYGHERCADALRVYNQQHPRSSERVQKDGALTPGDTVIIPEL